MDPSVFDLNNYGWSYLKTDLILFLSCENIMSCYVSVESNGQLKVFHPTERKHGEPCRYKGRNWGVFPRFPAALCGEGPTEAMIRESLGMELAISRKWKNIIGVKGKGQAGRGKPPDVFPLRGPISAARFTQTKPRHRGSGREKIDSFLRERTS
jgi:hypothetical protein